MKRQVSLIVLVLLLCCCRGREAAPDASVRHFKAPTVPSMIQGEEGVMSWLALHYWDCLTDTSEIWLCDNSYVAGIPIGEMEMEFANYTMLLDNVPFDKAMEGMAKLYSISAADEQRDSSSNLFEQTAEIVEKYLFDPNSPLRNEDYYQPFVERLSTWEGFSPEQAMSYSHTSSLCKLNRVGTHAANFEFSDKNGHVSSLYGIKADIVLLFFSNPGCTACKEIIEALKTSDAVEALISSGRMAVANIYIDEEIDAWYEYMPLYPEEWHNGYDHNFQIRSDFLYNVRAIPSLYLLDSDKRVIMKDAPLERVMPWIENFSRN